MKKTFLIPFASIFLASGAFSANFAGYAGAFLRNGTGARPLGMGGAYTAIAEGADATYYNPAGLGFTSKVMFSSSYKMLSLDRHFGHIAIAFPIRNEAAMAASWVNAGVSNVTRRDESRRVLGNINNSSNAFALSFAKQFQNLISGGATLRYIQEKFDDIQSFTIGLDVGAIGRPHEHISIGAVFQNFGSTHMWESGGGSFEEKFPVVMKFGVAGNFLSERLIPAVDIETSDKSDFRLRAGGEYWFIRKIIREVEDEYEDGVLIEVEEDIRQAGLRIGVDRGNPTFGASFIHEIKNISLVLEYAYLFGRVNTSAGHLFTLSLTF